ncbi:acyl carrier protein [uncultured Porphyromonas sp.]|uniref:acyl carrier protein n=1 Tax=uncultured Porphyromonas sp. TaxID=159274 RepID=UPI0005E60221|nr:acyl carrier protein [uncultured Porphyromonas sp.]CQB87491.1 acyl carrier protein [Chlamydia trachomatis]
MTKQEIADKVIEIIVDKLNVDPSEVTETASFTNDLGADSLDTVELIMEFEKVFNITIEDEVSQNIQTVGDAISHIQAAVAEK